ncbi:MAG: hypothetical protein RQ801_07890 [Spirochaetaceae bacterium]|nr:hypothetical protein [Spirochaetaceae bacterium]
MKRIGQILVMLTAAAGIASGLEWKTWSVDVGAAWQYNGEIGNAADRKQPSKLMFNPGASFHADWDGRPGGLQFHPGFWLSWNIEDLQEGIARPSGEEQIDHMKVLGIMADFPFGVIFTKGRLDIGVQGGPAVYLRIPMYTAQEGTADPAVFWKAYYGGMEFLHLGLSSWVGFPVSDDMDFSGGLRIYQPVSTLWTDAPIIHGLQIGLFASLGYSFSE